MGFCGEVSSSSGYDSNVPIQSILSLFNVTCASVGYGDNHATFHNVSGRNENIIKANKYLSDFSRKYVAYADGNNLEVKVSSEEEILEIKLKSLGKQRDKVVNNLASIDKEIASLRSRQAKTKALDDDGVIRL